MTVERETYSIEELTTILGLARTTTVRHIEAGIIPAIRLGARTLIPRAWVDRLFAEAGCPRDEAAAGA